MDNLRKQADMTKRKPGSTRGNPTARFDSFTNFDGPTPKGFDTPCWLWTGATAHGGYAQFMTCVRGVRTVWSVHRFSYERHVGPIPDGYQIDHLCKVRTCVNPLHLEVVTPAENNRRSDSPSAQNARKVACPEGHPLTEDNLSRYHHERTGERRCRQCVNEYRREQYRRAKSA